MHPGIVLYLLAAAFYLTLCLIRVRAMWGGRLLPLRGNVLSYLLLLLAASAWPFAAIIDLIMHSTRSADDTAQLAQIERLQIERRHLRAAFERLLHTQALTAQELPQVVDVLTRWEATLSEQERAALASLLGAA